jgi:hypothetical protein
VEVVEVTYEFNGLVSDMSDTDREATIANVRSVFVDASDGGILDTDVEGVTLSQQSGRRKRRNDIIEVTIELKDYVNQTVAELAAQKEVELTLWKGGKTTKKTTSGKSKKVQKVAGEWTCNEAGWWYVNGVNSTYQCKVAPKPTRQPTASWDMPVWFCKPDGYWYQNDLKTQHDGCFDGNPPETGNPTPGPTTNPTPGPTANPTPGPTSNPTPGPTANPTRAQQCHSQHCTQIFFGRRQVGPP